MQSAPSDRLPTPAAGRFPFIVSTSSILIPPAATGHARVWRTVLKAGLGWTLFGGRRRVALRLAAGLALTAGGASATEIAPVRNVLLIVVDDLNTALGCYGDPLARTPNIDRLAARGVRFDRAYCQYPLCNPSRSSFLSGRRPENTGVYNLEKSARELLPDAVFLPQFFRQRGYFTAGAGKIFHNRRMTDPAWWDRYEDGPGADPQEKEAIRSRYANGDGRPAWLELDGDGTQTRDGSNAATIRHLLGERAAAGTPFFLAVGFHKPHLPWTAPRRFFEQHREADFVRPAEPAGERIPAIALQTELSGFAQPDNVAAAVRAYYACVSFIDEQVGTLLDDLDRRHLWDSTTVVFFSDHGFHLGDHGGLWAKLSAFEVANRVPLIIAGAGVPAGHRVDAPVELIDIYPTLVALTGGEPPAGLEGHSLAPLWSEGAAGNRAAFSLVYHFDVAGGRDVAGRTVYAQDWRYTEWNDGAEGRELYRRRLDPGESRNLAGAPSGSDVVEAGAALLCTLPAPKAGPANRPRALVAAERSAAEK